MSVTNGNQAALFQQLAKGLCILWKRESHSRKVIVCAEGLIGDGLEELAPTTGKPAIDRVVPNDDRDPLDKNGHGPSPDTPAA